MNDHTGTGWRRYAERLVDGLVRRGALHDHRWGDALLAVPRHHFVPAHYTRSGRGGPWRRHDPGAEPDAPGWLRQAYSDAALTIALSELDMWGDRRPVAASPPPELTVRGLQALGVQDGDRLLHLGVGSGHTTALAAHRLSGDQVVGVEIDPDLLRAAVQRLRARDVRATVVAGDGGMPVTLLGDGAAFDRVLVGYESDEVPAAWVRHVRPGGRLLARLAGGLGGGGHVLLERPTTDPRAASAEPPRLVGRFLGWTGHSRHDGSRRAGAPSGVQCHRSAGSWPRAAPPSPRPAWPTTTARWSCSRNCTSRPERPARRAPQERPPPPTCRRATARGQRSRTHLTGAAVTTRGRRARRGSCMRSTRPRLCSTTSATRSGPTSA